MFLRPDFQEEPLFNVGEDFKIEVVASSVDDVIGLLETFLENGGKGTRKSFSSEDPLLDEDIDVESSLSLLARFRRQEALPGWIW